MYINLIKNWAMYINHKLLMPLNFHYLKSKYHDLILANLLNNKYTMINS